jgi:integrase
MTLKTKRSRRTLKLSEDHIVALRKHWENQAEERRLLGTDWHEHGLIFPAEHGGPLRADNLRRGYWRLLKRAKVSRARFHDLRHTAGSLMIEAGVPIPDVSAILGHANPAITARIYLHSSEESQKRAVGATERIAKKSLRTPPSPPL